MIFAEILNKLTMYRLLILCVLMLMSLLTSQICGELIVDLPGLEKPVNFKQYSGYITVDPKQGTRLFYWYVESQNNPSTDPLVLWLNGGPGCSSLGGFLGELGPFYVHSNLSLGLNEYSWNKNANMLFLESPAGVGFSKSDKAIDYNDEKTASDSFTFLMKFFEMYPHLKNHSFWLTGESYAGHYIPTLTAKIVAYNQKLHVGVDKINLTGLMIGNPLTYLSINGGGVADYIYSHQLVSEATHLAIREFCNYTFPDGHKGNINPTKCSQYEEKATEEMGNINPYDIYADVCLNPGRYSRSNGQALLHKIAASRSTLSSYATGLLQNAYKQRKNLRSPFYPCEDSFVQTYLNEPSVQTAIHAETTKWTDCNDHINLVYSQADLAASMLPIYKNSILGQGLKVLIYSGDVDSVVPATSTRRCLSSLNLDIKKPWAPWTDSKGQVGGYWLEYDGLVYATVRNAGHEVPTFQPLRAYDMFSKFLSFQKL